MHTRQGVAVPAQPNPNRPTLSPESAIEQLRQALAPIWEPLEKICPPGLCKQFMFMGKVGEIHLYKHVDSRRYLNVDPAGATYAFDSKTSTYTRISVLASMHELALDSPTVLDELFCSSERKALAILFVSLQARS